MFSPNTDSFVLTRRPIVKPGFSVFLPNTDSFLLIRRPVVKPGFMSGAEHVVATVPQSTDSGQSKIKDQSKRNFLKVAGVVGASAVASQILSPKQAQALILGSSPTTGVVGVKDSANARINPATEETLDEVLKTTDLTFDAGSLQVKVLSSALPTTASTETTLQTISFGGVQHALKITTVGSVDYIGEAPVGTAFATASWRAKKVDSTTGIIITWADGNANFDNSAVDLTTLNYS